MHLRIYSVNLKTTIFFVSPGIEGNQFWWRIEIRRGIELLPTRKGSMQKTYKLKKQSKPQSIVSTSSPHKGLGKILAIGLHLNSFSGSYSLKLIRQNNIIKNYEYYMIFFMVKNSVVIKKSGPKRVSICTSIFAGGGNVAF